MKPFVTFIIPAFNSEKTIKKCLKCLFLQTYGNDYFEVIVVDNNSTDKTEEIVHTFSHVKLIKEERQGRSFARNTGANHAKGNFLAFIDSDVFLHQEWLSHLMNDFKIEIFGGGQGRIIPSNYDGQELLNRFRIRSQKDATSGSNIILDLKFAESPMINSAACLYHKDAFNFVGGFDPHLERHEDIDLSKRVSLAGFDLFSNSKAIAEVEYHAEGWISYFMRSFEEGKTKEAYLQKWKKLKSKLINEDILTNRKVDSATKQTLFPGITLVYYQVRDEIVFNFFKGILWFDIYYIIKSVNAFFKSLGRLMGKMSVQYLGEPELLINEQLTSRYVKINDKKIYLEKNIRFVYKDQDLYYLQEIVSGDFVDISKVIFIKEVFINNDYE